MPAVPPDDDPLPAGFLPLHKLAFGLAIGTALAVVTFLVTAVYLIRNPPSGFNLGILASYFAGYSVSWGGAFIGAAWAGFSGFVIGFFAAFLRNFSLAVMLFVVRTRAELAQTRDFLDHI